MLYFQGERRGELKLVRRSERGFKVLLPTSQPSKDARLARRQRIVPREGCCMQKNSRSTYEKCKCKV